MHTHAYAACHIHGWPPVPAAKRPSRALYSCRPRRGPHAGGGRCRVSKAQAAAPAVSVAPRNGPHHPPAGAAGRACRATSAGGPEAHHLPATLPALHVHSVLCSCVCNRVRVQTINASMQCTAKQQGGAQYTFVPHAIAGRPAVRSTPRSANPLQLTAGRLACLWAHPLAVACCRWRATRQRPRQRPRQQSGIARRWIWLRKPWWVAMRIPFVPTHGAHTFGLCSTYACVCLIPASLAACSIIERHCQPRPISATLSSSDGPIL